MAKLLTEENFEKSIEKGVSIVDFYADWCAPCKMMAPIIDDLANEFEDNDEVNIYKIDTQAERSLSAKFGIMSIPTLIVFKDGEKVDQFAGLRQKDFLLEKISEHK